MNVTLVEYAQHDVHGHHCRQNQQQRAGQRRLKRFGSALKLRLHANRHADLLLNLLDHLHGLAQSDTGGQVERHHDRRKLPQMSNSQLCLTLLDARQTRQFHLRTIGGLDVDLLQRRRTQVTAGRSL